MPHSSAISLLRLRACCCVLVSATVAVLHVHCPSQGSLIKGGLKFLSGGGERADCMRRFNKRPLNIAIAPRRCVL